MNDKDRDYHRLQRHLNRQAIGFPASRSGAEIRFLKRIFTPYEAQVATCLTYKYELVEKIYERCGALVQSPLQLNSLLDRIVVKGGLECRMRDGRKYYANAPLMIGMYEMQNNRLDPDLVRDFNEYLATSSFGIEVISAKLPQTRTIPIKASIKLQLHTATYDDVGIMLESCDGPFVLLDCICRKKKAIMGEVCKVTQRKETCLGIGSYAQLSLIIGIGREISRAQAVAAIEQNQREGLVLQPSNTEKPDFICSCCGCCCAMLGLHRVLPKPLDFWASNHIAVVDQLACKACGLCISRCQVDAMKAGTGGRPAQVDLNLCIGCGLCVPTCPQKAVSLSGKPVPAKPPLTREELNEIIMAHKKGRLGKLKLIVKLIIDALLTGRSALFRKKMPSPPKVV